MLTKDTGRWLPSMLPGSHTHRISVWIGTRWKNSSDESAARPLVSFRFVFFFLLPDRFMQEYSSRYSYITYLAVPREGEHRKSNVPHKLDFLILYITLQHLSNFIRNPPHCFDVYFSQLILQLVATPSTRTEVPGMTKYLTKIQVSETCASCCCNCILRF